MSEHLFKLSEHTFEPRVWINTSLDLTGQELIIKGSSIHEPLHIKNPLCKKISLCKVWYSYVDENIVLNNFNVGIYKPSKDVNIIKIVDEFVVKNVSFIAKKFFHFRIPKPDGVYIAFKYDYSTHPDEFSSDVNFVLLMKKEPYKFIFIKI
jgi:hypothetical protein